LISVLGIITVIIAVSVLDIPGGFKIYSIESGSMEPSIKINSIVLVKRSKDFKENEIITFVSDGITVTHRINKIAENNIFYTKGDANEDLDSQQINKDQIIGKVVMSVPYLGYPVSYAKTKEGLIVLIVIPATLIIYSEVLKIIDELRKILKNKKIGKKKKNLNKFLLFLMLIFLPQIGKSNAILFDSEVIKNQMSAGTWGETEVYLYRSKSQYLGFKLYGWKIKEFDNFNYLLTYNSDRGNQGFTGVVDIKDESEIIIDNLFLGYCSGDICISDSEVEDIRLDIKLNGSTVKHLNSSL